MEYGYKKIGKRFYPTIPVLLTSGTKEFETDALIDSGSMLSLFRLEAAQCLGIDYKNGKPVKVASVQGELLVYVHQLNIEACGKSFSCLIGFLESFTPTLNLLGRIGFFEQYKITFDEKRKKVTLEGSG